MSSRWEPAVAQAMQRHGGSHRSKPKVTAPAIVPDATPPSQKPMAMQGVSLVPESTPQEETWD